VQFRNLLIEKQAPSIIKPLKQNDMNAFTSFFKKLTSEVRDDVQPPSLTNPSDILRVNREEITGTLEIFDLDEESTTNPLRISWIKQEGDQEQTEPVWVTEEVMLM
jgi:hypothetical protein